jgi:hypothetical protein
MAGVSVSVMVGMMEDPRPGPPSTLDAEAAIDNRPGSEARQRRANIAAAQGPDAGGAYAIRDGFGKATGHGGQTRCR